MADTRHDADLLIVGGGMAGTFAAIGAKEANPQMDVILLDKATVGLSGQSVFAAGVFNVFFPHEDNLEEWMAEIVLRGEFLNDQRWVEALYPTSYEVATKLDSWSGELGIPVFEKNPDGTFIRRKSRGHIKTSHLVFNAIPTMQVMRKKCLELGVKIVDRVMATRLLHRDGRIVGVVGFNPREGRVHAFRSKGVILACSGASFRSMYVGHRNLCGDMQAEAYRRGVELVGLEKTYANAGSKDYDIHGMNLFVGSGGRFLNGRAEEFMWNYDQLGNRARLQDLVIGFSREVQEGRGPIYMDMMAVSEDNQKLMRKILPETFRTWDDAGVNPFGELMEWMPAWSGTRGAGGGIRINVDCETNLEGLYAAGDITDEPVHGTYSFGGINIGFAACSGLRAGRAFALYAKGVQAPPLWSELNNQADQMARETFGPLDRPEGIDQKLVLRRIQEILIRDVGWMKNRPKLERALEDFKEVHQMVRQIKAGDPHELMLCLETENMALLGELLLVAGLVREESRGFHFRTEFPYSDNKNWLKWILVQRGENEKPSVRTESVPLPFFAPSDERQRPPGLRHEEARAMGLKEKPGIIRKGANDVGDN